MRRVTRRVNHGTWSHAGNQDKHCEACRKGIGCLEIDLKPMKQRRKSKEKTK